MAKLTKKVKKNVANFKAGYSAGRKPALHYASRAFDTATNVVGAAVGGPFTAAASLGFTAMQLNDMNKVGSKAGRLGRKVGSKVRTSKQKLALKKAQLASAKKRAASKLRRK